ncbi:MAG TPA: tetratricopeptide repeat protein, partial [Bryobacteraceae bacterium]|nr:tetratricopeptide repeat protein [Bryobacteraceae bacterium]
YGDPDYTTANSHVRAGLTGAGLAWAFTSSDQANWIPLTWISHMADYQLFGSNPRADHAVNLTLHVLSALLLFALLKRMTQTTWPSALVAFAFGLHPLHVESVAWIAERKDVLCALFFFLAIWLYLGYAAKPGPWRYAVMAIAFVCALLSKPMAVTLPFLLLVLDWWPLRRFAKTSVARLVIEKIPLIALAIAASVVTFMVERGAAAVMEGIPVDLRLENAILSYVIYLWKSIWPADLAVFYPYPSAIALWQCALAALLLAAITALAIALRPSKPYLLAGWLWFLGTLVPVIGLVQAGEQARADRYMYIPLIGLAIMFFFAAADFVNRESWRRPPAALVAGALCLAWIVAARTAVGNWRDSSTLFQHALAVTHDNYVAYTNLASAQRQAGNNDDAIDNFRHALEIHPHFLDAENGLGETLTTEGRIDDGISYLTEAVSRAPRLVSARINLGAAYSRKGMAGQAEEQYRLALQLDSESAIAHCGLGVSLNELGRSAEALPQLLEAVRIDPHYADAHYNLGRILALDGRTDEAIIEFREAIRIDRNNPESHYNLGVALAVRGKMLDAAHEFEKAVDLKPDYINARFNYASALADMQDYSNAIPQFEGLLRMAPNFAPAREALNRCRALQKDQPDPGGSRGKSK